MVKLQGVEKTILIMLVGMTVLWGDYTTKVRDIVVIEGVKRNIFTGYGLVVGLPGTGDSQSALAEKSLYRYLEFSGLDIEEQSLRTRNVASVAVSSRVYGFASKGDQVQVDVASIGDAKNIDNGLLLTTTLKGADGAIYIVAQGIVHTGDRVNARRGTIPLGGIVERSFGTMQELLSGGEDSLNFKLKISSFETMESLRQTVDAQGRLRLITLDNKRFQLQVVDAPPLYSKDLADFMKLDVQITTPAKVVIDKKTKVIVIGANVHIDTTFIALDGISITIGQAEEQRKSRGAVLSANTTVQDLADGLAFLGVKIEKIISIFEALSQSGALNAEILVQ